MSSKTFMQWKVPERLTADPAKRQREPDNHDTESLSSPLAREYRKVMPASARDIPTPGSVLRRERTMFPAINRTLSSMSKITETPMPKSAREPMMSEPVKAPTPLSRAASRKASATVQKPKTQIKPSKTFATQNVLKAYNQPDITSKAEDFLRTAPDHQRHLVEKTLKLAGKAKSPPEKDDQEAIYKWMKTATDKDRQVALKFFQSMLGSQLLGSASDEEQSKRVQHVIKVLEKGRPFGVAQAMDRPAERETRLRYIRLLTPGTRSNRWMHTTWHHLPDYNDVNPVYNKSSIYTQPHAPVHRHFKIHPDWGP